MTTHSTILFWEIPWTEEPVRLESMESQRVGHDLSTQLCILCFPFYSTMILFSRWNVYKEIQWQSHKYRDISYEFKIAYLNTYLVREDYCVISSQLYCLYKRTLELVFAKSALWKRCWLPGMLQVGRRIVSAVKSMLFIVIINNIWKVSITKTL